MIQSPPPPTGPLFAGHHNHLRMVRCMAVEGMADATMCADQIQSLAYQALVLFEEASKYEQEVRNLPPVVAGKMPAPLEDA